MSVAAPIWRSPEACLAAERPDGPMLFFAPQALTRSARRFLDGFPGLVTYAVKANPEPAVLLGLIGAGVRAFDVASCAEIDAVRALAPDAALHYHNPVKSRGEIAHALAAGVRTFALDSRAELEKLIAMADGRRLELSVRFRLPVPGAAYDFGAKFGADPEAAVALLRRAAEAGCDASLTFHPGTQCEDPRAWTTYIHAAARIAATAEIGLHRLNVGGGFPAALYGAEPDLAPFFQTIRMARDAAFPAAARPALVCEPGRAMAACCMALAARVKLVREDGAVFLSDGVYGGLDEFPVLGRARAFRVLDPEGRDRTGARRPMVFFGPTCDSVDRLPGTPEAPADIAEDDYVLFQGMGAYGSVTATQFNGFGALRTAVVTSLAA
jgi:ornithine decarboxylase